MQFDLELILAQFGVVILLIKFIIKLPQDLHLVDVIGVRVLHLQIKHIPEGIIGFVAGEDIVMASIHVPLEVVLNIPSDLPPLLNFDWVCRQLQ